MDFGTAFGLLKSGKAIKRADWNCRIETRELPGISETLPGTSQLMVFIVRVTSDGQADRWHPFDQDLLQDDWELA